MRYLQLQPAPIVFLASNTARRSAAFEPKSSPAVPLVSFHMLIHTLRTGFPIIAIPHVVVS